MYSKLFEPVLLKRHRCIVEEVRHSQMKEMRIADTLEPVISQHRLIVSPSVIKSDHESAQGYEGELRRAKTLIHQMTRLSRTRGALRHDDRIDALAIGVGHFVEILNQDAKSRAEALQRDRMEEELRRHVELSLKGNLGRTSRNRKWAARF